MNRLDQTQQLINKLGAELGMGELPLDDVGRHRTMISGLSVTFLHGGEPVDLLWLFVDIADVPHTTEQLQDLLRFGFTTWISNQMTLGLDESGQRLVGFASIPLAVLSSDNLRDVLGRLLAAAAVLADRIESGECQACGSSVEQCECTPMTPFRA